LKDSQLCVIRLCLGFQTSLFGFHFGFHLGILSYWFSFLALISSRKQATICSISMVCWYGYLLQSTIPLLKPVVKCSNGNRRGFELVIEFIAQFYSSWLHFTDHYHKETNDLSHVAWQRLLSMLDPRLPCPTAPVLAVWNLPTVAPELKCLASKAELNNNSLFNPNAGSTFSM
jgi:hypothetical protein